MSWDDWSDRADIQPGAPGLKTLEVSYDEWRQVAEDAAASGGRLLALWASPPVDGMTRVRAGFLAADVGLILTLTLDPEVAYPGIEDIYPAAARMQRAVADTTGIQSTAPDTRPWLRHAAWPKGFRPLVDPDLPCAPTQPTFDNYDFVRVEGDGVHEIAVGPVHAGTIEPGHFRFSVVGEKVLKLEERLGYAHKGIERRFTELPILQGHRLAARVSGDSAVAFSWAYCQALEGITGAEIPPRAAYLRALCLELERAANHLGDLGALGNDAGLAFGLMQFTRLKEELLRSNKKIFGERYLMEAIVPGGTRQDLVRPQEAILRACILEIERALPKLRRIYDEHPGLRDRFTGAGTVTPDLAQRLGLAGFAGRASGQAFDLRVDLPCKPYYELVVRKIVRSEGDVAARVALRFDELHESLHIVQHLLDTLPVGAHCTPPMRLPEEGALGIGLIEGWRGPVCIALESGIPGTIRRCHPHDPSWQNWPAIEHAIIGNIVPDFPLINKSFNLSYSGHDL
jgi:Ni,Fe-hydrogenase III large subunit